MKKHPPAVARPRPVVLAPPRVRPRRRAGGLVGLGCLACSVAFASTAAAAAVQPADAPAPRRASNRPAPVSLADLAVSYQRLERAVARPGWSASARDRADRAMDEATAAFFARRLSGAATAIDAAVLDMHGAGDDAVLRQVMALVPQDAVGSGEPVATLRLRARDGALRGAGIRRPFTILVLPDGPVHAGDLDPATALATGTLGGEGVDAGPANDAAVFSVPLSRPLPDGRYRVAVAGPFGDGVPAPALELGPWTVSRTSFDADRRRLESRLAAVPPTEPLDGARWIVRDRLTRLTDRIGPGDVTGFALDRVRLREQLEGEIARLEAGRDPHAGQPGDWWMRLPVDGGRWPVRIIAPAAIDAADTPPPLVLALHGAGGNEHLFVDGHAGGRLVTLAAERGFLLVSVPTTSLAVGGSLPGLLDAVAARHAFDPDRVLLIGHSLGAMTAGAQAGLHPGRVAAAALIAGGPTPQFDAAAAEPPPPLRYYGAARDTVIPASRVERGAAVANAAGADAEYRLVPDVGHLLVVEAVLDDAIDWLLSVTAAAADADRSARLRPSRPDAEMP
jgi:predicted esterase